MGVLSAKERVWMKIKYDRRIFELADGGELAMDWLVQPSDSKTNSNRNIVVCVPGLSGDSKENYCLCIA
jgi:predicted alpha/beta-fold hydrolase